MFIYRLPPLRFMCYQLLNNFHFNEHLPHLLIAINQIQKFKSD